MGAEAREALVRRRNELEESMNLDVGEELVKKTFTKKYNDIQSRPSYEGEFEESWWEPWPKKELPTRAEHWIIKNNLIKLAEELNYNSKKLRRLIKWLEEGASLGIKVKESRMPTRGRNSKSAYKYGDRVTDAMRDWVEQGIAGGPFTEEEVGRMTRGNMEDIKVSPMSVKLKDNGKVNTNQTHS